MALQVKRIYDPPAAQDGVRILVDRIWPRGLSKEEAKLDAWLKGVAPSAALRQWFAHDPAKWAEFRRRYFVELDACGEPLAELLKMVKHGRATLLYSAKDTEHNNAAALAEYLARRYRVKRD